MNNKNSKNLTVLSVITGFLFSLSTTGGNLVAGAEPEEYSFISKMGSKGSGDGQFITPHTVAFDSSGNMYVTDTKNSRVQKFDSNGTFRDVEGEGVVGVQPILQTGENYQYVSGCNLRTEMGRMQGTYEMENLHNKTMFEVNIPSFEMIVPFKGN